jgi:hypothetical protein
MDSQDVFTGLRRFASTRGTGLAMSPLERALLNAARRGERFEPAGQAPNPAAGAGWHSRRVGGSSKQHERTGVTVGALSGQLAA